MKRQQSVAVLNMKGKPLMPCSSRTARLLLKEGKAKVKRREPFVIQLLIPTGETKQKLTLGVDPGAKTMGTCVRQKTKVVYASEVILRTDIPSKMKRRAMYRRNRRNRKTRYREPRFLNRTRSKKWLTPTLRSKVQAHKKELNFILSVFPITGIVYEYSAFDIHKISNPSVKKWEYQKGKMYGYENVKQYVLHRDNYKCRKCKASNTELHVHHVVFKSKGGTDTPNNLICLCHTCHKDLHAGKWKLTATHLKTVNTKPATQVSTVNAYVWRWLERLQKKKGFGLKKTYGYLTKVKRIRNALKKHHFVDAYCISLPEEESVRKPVQLTKIWIKKCVPLRDKQMFKGVRSEQKIETGKIQGFRKFDKVLYNGTSMFIKGRMSTGYAILMDVQGTAQKLKPIPKFGNMELISRRKSWIVSTM